MQPSCCVGAVLCVVGERQGPTVVIIAGQGHEPTQPQIPWSDSGHFLSDSSQNSWQRIWPLVEPRKSPRMGVCPAKTSMRATLCCWNRVCGQGVAKLHSSRRGDVRWRCSLLHKWLVTHLCSLLASIMRLSTVSPKMGANWAGLPAPRARSRKARSQPKKAAGELELHFISP